MKSDKRGKGKPAKPPGPRSASSSKIRSVDGISSGRPHAFSIQPEDIGLTRMLKTLKPHDHLCLIYESQEEWRAAAAPFISIGLKQGEKCIYIVDTSTAEEIRKYLLEEGVDVASAEKSGQLSILHETEAYTREGSFDPDRMIALLISETEKAVSEGYPALRTTGEMTWVLRGHPGSEKLLEYEAKLNRDLFPQYPCLAICQYDRWKFDPEIIKGVIMTHPLLVRGSRVYRNFYYVDPGEFLNKKRAEREVQRWLNNVEREQRLWDELRESGERFHTSVETLLEGFAILSAIRDSNGQIIDFKYEYINEAGCKMNQKPLEEHMRKTLLELLPTHKEIGLFDEYVRVVETGQSLTKEFLIYETVYGSGKRLRQAFDVQITRLGDGFVTTWQDITDKKKGEELLRQSEERLKLLIENSKDVIIMADLGGSIIYYNGPPEYGITTEQVLGKNLFSIFDPVIAARLMNQMKRVIKGGEALTFENNIPWKGESFWFLNQMYPIRDKKGRMIGVGGIARNITERKRGEEEYKTILLTAMDGFWVTDTQGRFLDTNDAYCRLIGYRRDEMLTMRISDVEAVETPGETAQRIKKIMEVGGDRFETRHRCKDGKIVDVEISVNYNDAGGGRLFVFARDITERKRLEEILKKEQQELKLIIDSSPIILFYKDKEGKFIRVNKAFSEALKMHEEEFVGKTVFDLYSAKIAQGMTDDDQEVFKSGSPKLNIIEQYESASGIRWVQTDKIPICDKNCIPVGLIGFAQDITERKQAEDREQLSHEVLTLLNRWETTTNTTREILLLFKKKMGFEAVGIRLREGDDFPYFETNGFSEDFVQAERHLCAYDKEGKIVRDGKGTPVLECMCGNVLCGRTDAALPFFTAGGSFWTNSTTDLLASTTEEDRQSRTRSRCNGEGYESVALIPLRSGDEIIGLLQLNDRRRNQFTLKMIHFFEGVGASIGIALSRKRVEEALRMASDRWQTTFDGIKDSIFLLDKEGVIFQINKNAAELFGKTEKEIQGHHCWEIVHGTSEPIAGCPIVRMKQSKQRETMFLPVDDKWYEVTVDPLLNQDGNLLGAVHIISDITERKQAEEALKKSEALLKETQQISKVGGWELDVETGKITWTDEVYRIYGVSTDYDPSNIPSDMSFYKPGSLSVLKEAFQKALDKGEPYDLELEFNSAKGEDLWVRTIGKPTLSNGRVVKISGNIIDITERKRTEKEREQLFEQVRVSRERLRNLSRRLVEVQEVERRGLVRKLHDEVGQSLTALSINLNIVHNQLPPETATKMATRIDDSLKLVEETVERIRDVMAELRPPVLDDYGLMAALNWYGRQFSERTGIATAVEGEELMPRLPLATETALFRITQEALTNVAKHGQAKQVIISLKSEEEKFYLTIADDGIGFEQQQQQQQWGLINMRERAQAVGGTLNIETAPGKGTKVMVEVLRNH
jgi:PAS domain S-box-containing protein